MAINTITNKLFYHVDNVDDIIALGSDDGLTLECLAWVETISNFCAPVQVLAQTSSWEMVTKGTPSGLPNLNREMLFDIGNNYSAPDNGLSYINDVQGNASGGTKITGASVVDSHMSFDGVAGAVSFAKNSVLDNLWDSGGGTLLLWFRNTSTSGTKTLISTRGPAGNSGWDVKLLGSESVQFRQNFSITDYAASSTPEDAVVDRWTSLAIRGTTSGVDIFFDGKLVPSFDGTPAGTRNSDVGNDIYIGRSEDGDNPYTGDIDIVGMWDRQLSDIEIRQAHDVYRQRFIRQGMVLIDTLTATADVTTLTFDGLNGNADGTYYLVGRVATSGAILVEARPNGLASNIGSDMQGITASSTGWVIAHLAIPEGSAQGTILTEATIYPEANVGGSSGTRAGRRMYQGNMTLAYTAAPTSANVLSRSFGGFWDEASTNMHGLTITTTTGTMLQGTSFSLYYIEDKG